MDLVSFLGTFITPVMLFLSSAAVLSEVDFRKILSPRRFFRTLADLPEKQRSSPLRSLSLALAGTLGVGNITGVCSAIIMGGPGAVFWMWIGAVAVLPVKYAETFLAVKYRRKSADGYLGGAFFYIRDGFSGGAFPSVLGGIFAVLCCLNSLITGNIVQSNAAACVFGADRRLYCGIALGVLLLAAVIAGVKRTDKITAAVIPPLCAVYLLIGLYIILSNLNEIPAVFGEIFSSAFGFRALGGGVFGISVKTAIRYGVMRGIFSNEAGCGTSPTAHASAETKSPHHQACYGIVEVVFDTLVLCTVTALVLLIADRKYGILPYGMNVDVSPITLGAFTSLTGNAVYYILLVSVFLFAYSTLIAQYYYGIAAVNYLTDKKIPRVIYSCLSIGCAVLGSVISAPVMWTLADLIIGIMTAVNCAVVIMLRRRLTRSPSEK